MTRKTTGSDDLTYPWKPPKMTEPGRVRDSLDDYADMQDVLGWESIPGHRTPTQEEVTVRV